MLNTEKCFLVIILWKRLFAIYYRGGGLYGGVGVMNNSVRAGERSTEESFC